MHSRWEFPESEETPFGVGAWCSVFMRVYRFTRSKDIMASDGSKKRKQVEPIFIPASNQNKGPSILRSFKSILKSILKEMTIFDCPWMDVLSWSDRLPLGWSHDLQRWSGAIHDPWPQRVPQPSHRIRWEPLLASCCSWTLEGSR